MFKLVGMIEVAVLKPSFSQLATEFHFPQIFQNRNFGQTGLHDLPERWRVNIFHDSEALDGSW